MRLIDTTAALDAATDLATALGRLVLPFDLPGAASAGTTANAAAEQLRDYVIPRLRDLDAPLLAVIGGSTGAGKSTLFNSLIGQTISRPGVLRPTTRTPVLVHHPDARRWFADDRVLPTLRRVDPDAAVAPGQLALAAADALPPTIALLDAPDVDSVVDANRQLAAQLLAAADLWVFVTTAARYADAVPWGFLRDAAGRGVHVAVVLNRVPPGEADEIAPHLTSMLADERLGGAPVFVVDEQPLVDGLLPSAAVQPLRVWLAAVSNDDKLRADVIRRGLAGTVGELIDRAERAAAAAEAQDATADELVAAATTAFTTAGEAIAADVRDGTIMRGEVLARWQELIGTGEFLRSLQSSIGRLRDRIASAITRRPPVTDRFQGAVTTGIEVVVAERVAQAVDQIAAAWRSSSAGAALLTAADTAGEDLRRPSAQLAGRVAAVVSEWQDALLELLRREGAGKRNAAKALSYGVNGLGAVLMVGVFAQTGGLTGAEVAIAGGSTALGHKLLEAILGDQAVRTLAADARTELERRLDVDVLGPERQRFVAAVAAAGLTGDGSDIRASARALAAAMELGGEEHE